MVETRLVEHKTWPTQEEEGGTHFCFWLASLHFKYILT
jgi:hypothetical protein